MHLKMAASAPPPPPPEIYRLSGLNPPDKIDDDPTKPIIGFAENSELGLFIYLVSKVEILKNLLDKTPDYVLKSEEPAIVKDIIIPSLTQKLQNSEFVQLYPHRSIFTYDYVNKDEHIQTISHVLLKFNSPGIYEFLACDECKKVLSVNQRFPEMPYIKRDATCSACSNDTGIWVSVE